MHLITISFFPNYNQNFKFWIEFRAKLENGRAVTLPARASLVEIYKIIPHPLHWNPFLLALQTPLAVPKMTAHLWWFFYPQS